MLQKSLLSKKVTNRKSAAVTIVFFYISDTTGTNTGTTGLSRHNSTSSAMTPNVSDPGIEVASGQLTDDNSQLSSPPKPVSTLQHNYSTIHQPIPRCVHGLIQTTLCFG